MVWNWANYCYLNEINLEEARQWAENLSQAAPMYWTHALSARLKAVTGDSAGAVEAAKLALERAQTEADQPGVTPDSETLQGELEAWQAD